jgi:hypothetical protein
MEQATLGKSGACKESEYLSLHFFNKDIWEEVMATKQKRNWKKAKDYESMRTFNSFQWAWEFLRRNPEYIKKWEEVIKKFPEVVHDFNLGPPATKWGLEGYFNPYKNHPPCFEGLGEVKIYGEGYNQDIIILSGPLFKIKGTVKCSFDLNQPIIPQLATARKILLGLKQNYSKENKARSLFKPQRSEWIMLIRILDAIASGAKDKDIAEALFHDEKSPDPYAAIKKVYDKKKQAQNYVDGDYKLILYSEK